MVAPGAVFGFIAISNGRRALAEAVGRQFAEEARSTADSLSAVVDNGFAVLRTFARQDLMREIRIGDLDKRISTFLVSVSHGEEAIFELRIADPTGRVVAASDPARIGQIDPLAVFHASGEPTAESLRGPTTLPETRRRVLELSVPIPDPDRTGMQVGRLTALYDWERVTHALTELRRDLLEFGIGADVLMTDGAGVVIAGAGLEGTQTPLGADLLAAGWTSVDERLRPTASGFTVEPAARTLVAHARLRERDQKWTVLVAQPLSQALAPVTQMTIRLGVALAAVLAGALGLAVVLANRVTGPLSELTRATQDLASGERGIPVVSIRSHDEVGELAAAFNRMAVDLRRAQSEVLEAAKFAFLGELAAGVAHEVRTTLGVLRSSVQILQPSLGARDAEAAELIEIMLAEIEHLDGVVTQLLNLGRPREPAIGPARLSEVVFRAVDFAEAQARPKSISLRRVAAPDDPTALCDEEQLYQVALNLVVNAVQVLSPGGEVTVAILPARNGTAGFEVRDDGPGIPDEIRQQIFAPFFTRREGGIGLGLTFVQRVVREHKGTLSVQSEVGGGSVFRVELPASET